MSNNQRFPTKFIMILYSVPNKPSRLKVKVWRKIKSIGGIYPKLSICIIPDKPEIRDKVLPIVKEIRENGMASILEINPLSSKDANTILNVFSSEKEREYKEILEECQEFLDEIKKNIKTGNITQEEGEELEEMLEGLRKWYKHVSQNDLRFSEAREEVEKMFKRCEEELEKFVEKALEK